MSEFYTCPLASGSSGNCYYIENIDGSGKRTRILIDAGLSLKALRSLLNGNLYTDVNEIDALFITHEHTDHIKGLGTVVKKCPALPVYMHEQSYYAAPDDVKLMMLRSVRFFDVGMEISIGNLKITPFRTPHDSMFSVGYTFTGEDNVKEIGFATDLGTVTKDVYMALTGCKRVYLESNYDVDMLRMGRYSVSLKRRIVSKSGHLSNADCAEFIPYLARNGTESITLCHLSEENNTHSLAYNSAVRALEESGTAELVKSLAIAPKTAAVRIRMEEKVAEN